MGGAMVDQFDWLSGHLDEGSDLGPLQGALSYILAEVEAGPAVLVEVGRCSHWLRPHQTRWTADGGFPHPTGYGSGRGGHSLSGLPQFDWSVVLEWSGSEWEVVPRR